MSRRLALITALVLAGAPAYAVDYGIVYPGSDRPNELRQNTEPQPGIDCPEGSKYKIFAPQVDEQGKLDPDYRNYILTAGGFRRVLESASVDTKPQPNIDGFYADLAASGVVSDDEFSQALRCKFIPDAAQRDQKILEYAAGLAPVKLKTLLELAQKNAIALPIQQ